MSGEGSPTISVDGTGLDIVVIAGTWHEVITDGLIAGAQRALDASGASHRLVRVPGSFELSAPSSTQLGDLHFGSTFRDECG